MGGVGTWGCRLPLLVVGSIDEDLVEDLVEAEDIGDRTVDHLVALIDPQRLGVLLDRADVGVEAEEDVLELALLLVGLVHNLGLARPAAAVLAMLLVCRGSAWAMGCNGRGEGEDFGEEKFVQ
ncbi:hypothetical protein NL676_032045 [Syzygium grande]|nr:hypothetical protein NL676_032045 [Syzygium grande]